MCVYARVGGGSGYEIWKLAGGLLRWSVEAMAEGEGQRKGQDASTWGMSWRRGYEL